MSGRSSKRVNLSPDDVSDKQTIFLKRRNGTCRVAGSRRKVAGIFVFRMPKSSKFSPVRSLRRLGAKVARTLRFVCLRRKSSRKVSSATLIRSRSLVDATDSQRAEAIEDCIEFLNSSSSLQRSSSVSTTSSC